MNILFMSLQSFRSIHDRGINPDLLWEFAKNGDQIYILSPVEKVLSEKEMTLCEENFTIVRVPTGKIQKTNFLEKGINTLLIETRFIRTIKKNFSNIRFDLVLYPTPPITFVNAVKYIKARDGAKSYLMLKDIFPQNAIDIGLMRRVGVTSLLYRYFRAKEKRLYAISDKIGCMSLANVEYVITHNPEIPAAKVEICANTIAVRDLGLNEAERAKMRHKYGLPLNKKIFVYGGNIGKPQGIQFLNECLKTQIPNPDVFFLIVGSGTEYGTLKVFFDEAAPKNMRLMESLPKDDYDQMIAACDVGLIFLDHRFTIPNFPSRLLSYMQAKLPVLACTDPNTDIGKVIVDGGFGWWCESNDANQFKATVQMCLCADTISMGKISYQYLLDHYSVEQTHRTIMASL